MILRTVPSTVYRYRTFSSSTIDLLCNNELFFANPGDFNDPFDCAPFVEVDSDLPRLQAILKELVATRVRGETLAALKNAKFSETMAISHAEQVAKREALQAIEDVRHHASNPEHDDRTAAELGILRLEIQLELQNRYGKGICCFSEEFNSPLLWSHYGDQHRGLCIGYFVERRPRPELKQVSYGGDRTITTSSLEAALLQKNANAIALLDAKVLLRKAPDWEYEREWRLISNVGLQESPLKLTEVTFGLRCANAVRHTLMRALDGRPDSVAFYEMRNIRGTFNLERVPVDSEDTCYLPRTAMSGIEAFGDPNES